MVGCGHIIIKNIVFPFSGGPFEEQYKSDVVTNNITRFDADLGDHISGGPRKATAEFRGNTMVTYFHEMVDGHDVIDIMAYNTVDPKAPNEMTYTLKDVESGVEVIQKLYK